LLDRVSGDNRFARNVLVLMTGTAAAQVIGIAISPLLSRLYTPAEYGVYGVFIAVTTLLSTVSGGRYEMAVVLPKRDSDSLSVVALTILVAALVSACLLVVFLAGSDTIASLLKSPSLAPWLAAAPGLVFLTVSGVALRYWFNRRGLYKRMAMNGLWRTVIAGTLNIGFGVLAMGEAGLIYGLILGQAFTVGIFGWQLWKEDAHLLPLVTESSLHENARTYSGFPKFSVLSGLVEALASQLPTLVFAMLFNPATVGLFAFATRTVNMPLGIVSSAIGDVFRQQASAQYAETGECRTVFLRCAKRLFALSIVPFVGLFLLAPALFGFVFGSQWAEAGRFVQLMACMCLVRFVVSPLSVMFYIAGKQNADLMLQSALLVALGLALWFLGRRGASAQTGIMAYAGVYTGKYIVEFLLSLRFATANRRGGCGLPTP